MNHLARPQIEQIFEERMAALTAGVEQAVAESLEAARRDLAGKLNQAVRRLRGSENEAQWSNTLVEVTRGFCDRAALFTLTGGKLRLQAARNVDGAADAEDVALESAPAFRSAVESSEPVAAMRTRREMSDAIAALVGEADGRKFSVFPVSTGERVRALLYADSLNREVESNALELLATVAGAMLGSRSTGLVNIAAAGQEQEEQDLHLKAQRFARVQVAEMRLYKSENVRTGRMERDLYTALKANIDSAREVFRRDFLTAAPTMVDYLHLELVRTLANNDVNLLGPEYPGPMA